ncbi:MAG: hypothetical protein RQ733_01890 [Methyloprofundus sp.]|nr:hypothetical protein [Methyloprofundus sp.]MDT8424709.1 hypothetical protein [Methyloprofundus sp.]
MSQFITLMLRNILYLAYLFSCSVYAQVINNASSIAVPSEQENRAWESVKKTWRDDIQFHGFLSQGLFSSSGNNIYGKSKDSVSAGLTELGLNASYQALNNLSFAAQGLYRRAGANTGDAGQVTLDFAFVDLNLLNLQDGRLGIRGGRIKNPWGLYNETRDVAFTHPTILLPFAYFERSRALFLALDGGQLYADYNTSVGAFSFKFNYGWMNADDKDLLTAIINDPTASGHLESEPSFVTQLSYELWGGQYIVSLSYADLKMRYQAENVADPYAQMQAHIDTFVFSAQYNGEKFSFVGEYSLQWNKFTNIRLGVPDNSPVSEHWYVQAGYRILDNLQTTLRYDSTVQDISDRDGKGAEAITGGMVPAHLMYAQAIVFGLRWDITPSWMLRAEYHRVHGASNISLQDNPDPAQIAKDWNIYALQIAFRF